jgi:murein DD-endopeptidase MepM/ murein hydrolase activator NlpD
MIPLKQYLVPLTIITLSLLIISQVLVAPPAAFGLEDNGAGAAPVEEADSGNTPEAAALPQPPGPPLTVINGSIGRQPIYTELVSRGVAPSEVLCLARAFEGVFDFRDAKPRDEFQACLSPQNKLQKLTYSTSLVDRYVAVRNGDGTFWTYREAVPLEKQIVAKTIVIENSLYQALTSQGEGIQLVSAFADIFSWDIDFYLDPRKGDTIKILFEKEYLGSRFIQYGRILAAQYVGRQRTYSAFYYADEKQEGYYDETGLPLRKLFMRVPVKFGMRTSSFSTRRFHPVTKKYRRHTGIDYGAPRGTPIFATAGGVVEFSGWRGGYGKLVIVRHPNGYKTYYGHCNRIVAKKGTRVEQGQTIATVGRTGFATGPHVHYEIRIDNRPVDPNSIKTAKGAPLPGDQLGPFAQVVQDRLLDMGDRLLSQHLPPSP